MPLADMVLPAIAFEKFEIMINVVSFDFFSIAEYIDFGFTKTEPWSSNFDFLAYTSVNFIELVGSVLWMGLFCGIIALLSIIFIIFKCQVRFKIFESNAVTLSLVTFMTGTLFGNLVCISVSMKMLTYYEVLNSADHMSIAFQFIFLIAILAFFGYVTYFAIIVSPKIAERKRGR